MNENYIFGKSREAAVLPMIIKIFNRHIVQTTYKYATFDFYDGDYIFELKARKTPLDKYALIDKHKIINYHGYKNVVFLFEYLNVETRDLYYIVYDKEMFNNFETKTITNTHPHTHAKVDDIVLLIPTTLLQKIIPSDRIDLPSHPLPISQRHIYNYLIEKSK